MSAISSRVAPTEPLAIDHPSGFLALTSRNLRFEIDGVPGFIAFRQQGAHLISLGGVHAPQEARAALLDAFLVEAQRRRRRVLAVQVRAAQTGLFRSRGFTINRFGSTYGMSLVGFSLAGTRRMKLRNKIKRARAAGLRVLEVGHELPADEATFARLAAVSASWLRAKRKQELDFMIGELGTPGDPQRRIFVVVDAHETMLGFITYVPAWGARPGWLHDLTRRVPDALTGAMELCNAHAIERLQSTGARFLHFGFTPFVLCGVELPGASRLLAWALRMLVRYGRALYPARSQVEYKLKWAPEIIEPEFVAARPLSLRAVWDLLVLTRSL
jgi:lysylphosphatidylglycerol synthetase-like protein (DUF2156 family)